MLGTVPNRMPDVFSRNPNSQQTPQAGTKSPPYMPVRPQPGGQPGTQTPPYIPQRNPTPTWPTPNQGQKPIAPINVNAENPGLSGPVTGASFFGQTKVSTNPNANLSQTPGRPAITDEVQWKSTQSAPAAGRPPDAMSAPLASTWGQQPQQQPPQSAPQVQQPPAQQSGQYSIAPNGALMMNGQPVQVSYAQSGVPMLNGQQAPLRPGGISQHDWNKALYGSKYSDSTDKPTYRPPDPNRVVVVNGQVTVGGLPMKRPAGMNQQQWLQAIADYKAGKGEWPIQQPQTQAWLKGGLPQQQPAPQAPQNAIGQALQAGPQTSAANPPMIQPQAQPQAQPFAAPQQNSILPNQFQVPNIQSNVPVNDLFTPKMTQQAANQNWNQAVQRAFTSQRDGGLEGAGVASPALQASKSFNVANNLLGGEAAYQTQFVQDAAANAQHRMQGQQMQFDDWMNQMRNMSAANQGNQAYGVGMGNAAMDALNAMLGGMGSQYGNYLTDAYNQNSNALNWNQLNFRNNMNFWNTLQGGGNPYFGSSWMY